MQSLRTIFWVITAVIIVLFAMWNWTPVSVKIWPSIGGNSQGLRLDTFLPLVIIGSYLLGLLPVWLISRTAQWNLRRRLESSEREVANLRQQLSPPTPTTTGTTTSSVSATETTSSIEPPL